MFQVPEQYRIMTGEFATSFSAGNNGAFLFKFRGYEVFCIASDGLGWEHVSVSIDRERTPSWDIMNHVKNLFWGEEDTVLQFHPPKSEYVNDCVGCLHL
jgi:hypothetical protein